ncbi:hypothetical protein C8N37_101912 [Sphingobacterium faecium]|nr:hypothetical protein C8N37_101912 [Sphingobacterium faecium]
MMDRTGEFYMGIYQCVPHELSIFGAYIFYYL